MSLLVWRRIAYVGAIVDVVGSLFDISGNSLESSAIEAIKVDINSTQKISASTEQTAELADRFSTLAGQISIICFIISLIAIIGWSHSVVKTAYARDPKSVRKTPGWAIGSWFIPFYNLVMPRVLISEALKELRTRPPRKLLTVWWVVFLLSNLGSRQSGKVLSDAIDALSNAEDISTWNLAADSLQNAYFASTSLDILAIFSSLLFLALVIRSMPIDREVTSSAGENAPFDTNEESQTTDLQSE